MAIKTTVQSGRTLDPSFMTKEEEAANQNQNGLVDFGNEGFKEKQVEVEKIDQNFIKISTAKFFLPYSKKRTMLYIAVKAWEMNILTTNSGQIKWMNLSMSFMMLRNFRAVRSKILKKKQLLAEFLENWSRVVKREHSFAIIDSTITEIDLRTECNISWKE